MKRLGIIGGLGSWAGLHLAETLLRLSCAETDEQYPEFLLYNVPIRGMDKTGVVDGPQVSAHLKAAIVRLSRADCTHLIVACNSVHHLLLGEQNPFPGVAIDLIQCACAAITTKSVGVLCSRSSRNIGLYRTPLELLGVHAVEATEKEQAVIDDAIASVIRGQVKHVTVYPTSALREVMSSMTYRGAEEIVAGCTELSVSLAQFHTELPVIDAGVQACKAFLHD